MANHEDKTRTSVVSVPTDSGRKRDDRRDGTLIIGNAPKSSTSEPSNRPTSQRT